MHTSSRTATKRRSKSKRQASLRLEDDPFAFDCTDNSVEDDGDGKEAKTLSWTRSFSSFEALPKSLLVMILQCLPLYIIGGAIASLSKGLNARANSRVLWKYLANRDLAARLLMLNKPKETASRFKAFYKHWWAAAVFVDTAGWRWESEQWVRMRGVFAARDINKNKEIKRTRFAGPLVPVAKFDQQGAFHARRLIGTDKKHYVVDSGGISWQQLQQDGKLGSLINSPSGREGVTANVAAPKSTNKGHTTLARGLRKGHELLAGYGPSTAAIVGTNPIVRWQTSKPSMRYSKDGK